MTTELDWLASLNHEQHQIVTHPDGHMLVLAGAGSGKTRILVHRVVWLLRQGYTASEVMAVTFTNKAACEMRKRLENMLQCSLGNMWIGTFHGLAHRMLRKHHELADLSPDFQIIDAEDQQKIVRNVLRDLGLDKEVWPVKDSVAFINRHKEQGVRARHVVMMSDWEKTQSEIYRQYEQVCQQSNLVDFPELLLRSFELLNGASERHRELLRAYQQQFRHILVDEFQDTNAMQYQWVKLLSEGGYLLAVGDDDQSIYSWRGAEVANMRRLQQDYHGLELIRLERNYRSTAQILAAANAVIAHNRNRFGKQLWTSDEAGEPIALFQAKDERDEARFVCERIMRLTFAGRRQYQDMAVLYRSSNQSRALEERLTNLKIPYRIYGGTRFYERAEVKDLLAYLRLIVNEQDDVALARVINLPNRGVGEITVQKLSAIASEQRISLIEAIRWALAGGVLRGNVASGLQDLLDLLTKWRGLVDQLRLHELASCVKDDLALIEHYQKSKEYSETKKENIDELINGMRQFTPSGVIGDYEDGDSSVDIGMGGAQVTGDANNVAGIGGNWAVIREYLASVTLDADGSGLEVSGKADGQAAEDGSVQRAVNLMTIHAAKGLEFPVVFMVGMEEGLFPNARSLKESEDNLEEERRLCYVGMTRAQKLLHLSWCSCRAHWGGVEGCMRSRFLDELPSELLQESKSECLKFVSVYGKSGSYERGHGYSHERDDERGYGRGYGWRRDDESGYDVDDDGDSNSRYRRGGCGGGYGGGYDRGGGYSNGGHSNSYNRSSRHTLHGSANLSAAFSSSSSLLRSPRPSPGFGKGVVLDQQGKFKLQQQVTHEVYGVGTVVGFDGNGLVKVLFEKLSGNGKIKTISPDFLQ